MLCMVSLVGAQAAPNVLPLDHFNPHSLVLVCTKTTEKIANRTKKMMASDYPGMDVDLLCLNNAYEFQGICKELCAYLKKFEGSEVKFIFNLTGGTKMMSLAAFELAKQSSSRAIYFQSEENKNLIHNFHFDDGTLVIDDVELIDTYITLDQFLRLYLGEYNTRKQDGKNVFENNIIKILKKLEESDQDFEVIPRVCPIDLAGNIEIDFLLRYQNGFAVGEIKAIAKKSAFEQLNSICSRDVLGIYTRKFIIHTNPLGKNNQDLLKAYHIESILLEGGGNTDEDKNYLLEKIKSTLTYRKDNLCY